MYSDEAKIRKARVYLAHAYADLKIGSQENISIACNSIQIACELALKQVYVYYGKDFAHVHTIWELIEELPEEQSMLSKELIENLEDRAETIISWSANPKYNDNFNARIETINRYLKTVASLVECVSKCVIKEDNFGVEKRPNIKRMEIFGDSD